MKRVLFIFCLLASWSSAQEFKDGSPYSPYGQPSDDVWRIMSRAYKNPNALRELSSLPLEDGFDRLVFASRMIDTPLSKYDPLAPVAKNVLYTHPDFENFMQRTLRKMTTLSQFDTKVPLTPAGQFDVKSAQARWKVTRTPEEETKFKVAVHMWHPMLAAIQAHPSPEVQIRLLGPCLENSGLWFDMGSDMQSHVANELAEQLARAVSKLTGERIPPAKDGIAADVKLAREWWWRNEAKHRWDPSAAQPASVLLSGPSPTPIPKRILLPQNRNPDGSDAADGKDPQPSSTADSIVEKTTPIREWFIGGTLLLAAIGALASSWKKRRAYA